MKNYNEFILSKMKTKTNTGFDVSIENLHSMLFDFQKEIVKWSLKLGKSAIFADCGLGKTFMMIVTGKQ